MAGRPDHECFVCKGSAPPLVQCDRTGCTLVRFAAATLLPQARFTVAAAAARPAAAANAAADCPNLLTGIHLWRLTCASCGVGCRPTMPSASVDPCCTLEWSGTAVRRHCSCTFIRPAAPTRSSLSEAPGIFLLPTLLAAWFSGRHFCAECVRPSTHRCQTCPMAYCAEHRPADAVGDGSAILCSDCNFLVDQCAAFHALIA